MEVVENRLGYSSTFALCKMWKTPRSSACMVLSCPALNYLYLSCLFSKHACASIALMNREVNVLSVGIFMFLPCLTKGKFKGQVYS